MPRKKARTLTAFELEIMRFIWRHEETTVPDLQRALEATGRIVALPTIRTMLGILEQKGYVTRRTGRRRHVYRATVSAEDGKRRILKDVVERAFDGSAMDLVAALVNAAMISRRDLEKAKRLIQQHDKGAVK
jgi:predicted transcriptional regulator